MSYGRTATTDTDGRFTVTYPAGVFASDPVAVPAAVDPNPADGVALVATVESVSPTQVTGRVWRSANTLGLGVLPMTPAGEGIEVLVTATNRFA